MSDNLNDVVLNWDEPVDHIDESGPRIITDYGALQYLGAKKVQLFSAGNAVYFPNLVIDDKPYQRGGMKEGHVQGGKNAIAHFIAYFGLSFADDKPFTTVRVFTTQAGIPVDAEKIDGYPVIALDEKQTGAKADGKTVWLSDWSNLQFPALRQLAPALRTRFTNGEKLFFKADNWNTGAKPQEDRNGKTNQDGTPKKYYDNFWFNFTIFANEAEMLTARAAAKGSNGSTSSYSHYPVQWAEMPTQLPPNVIKMFLAGEAYSKIVTDLLMNDKAIGGGQTDPAGLMREILATWKPDAPQPLWTASDKALFETAQNPDKWLAA